MPQSPAPVFEAAEEISAETSVVVILQTAQPGFGPRAAALDAEMSGILSRACSDPAALAESGTCIDLIAPQAVSTKRVVVLALGKAEAVTTLSLARAGGLLAAHLEGKGECAATLVLDPIAGIELSGAEILARVALGMRLRRYRFDMRNRRQGAGADRTLRVKLVGAGGPDLTAALTRINAIADGVEYARTLVNLPPNHLHPDNFHDHLEPLREAGIDIEMLDAAQLKELGMNALLAVGSGSARPPRVAVLRYRGKGAPAQPLAFVGKGVCFDSGGLCIKGGAQMFDMKADMGGAAAVVGLLIALARQGSPVHVVGVLGIAENMPSGTALKPRDIITTASGQTVEVFDTDAEGRLLLADCLYYAATRFNPSVIVDLATLTYSVTRGLGSIFAGLFSTDDAIASQMIAAGETVGERFWRLPLDRAYDEGLQSPFADLRHHAKDMEDGDAPYAAAFLRHFTEDRPWVHLDIASKELTDTDRPLGRQGATAFGVQMLEEWVQVTRNMS
ncbi:leucyl aminopeptidase [Mesorhizobium sp. M7A.T.Ca.TU.009.01.3.2]|jgi:leucyl aminopeptidase|uniref:leucyl aminopeptidase n=2 Tax=Mesorhizobium TaxID=68287 RepID=UPI000FCC9050|nr:MULTISPECIES: leucyl aminopeptidase [unclassified Mesorhizobium]RUU18439.1 leucyl aminopeptidase [Mesorhizobium sp. M7A.T.Ca.TU.009.01.3.2]RUU87613.1 leucyl aminopeptidase [Mesorhizobium sp. M7A.T.Ca.TU.009.01.1.2]TJV22537.1 MAG: leucyl aminopeptidase [Mesorhizobium sp.]RUT87203.1 leucyl aminopeptidase [Mesorhizobium sp. M7A.T.Ca.US.000.02.1.1]RUT90455.1 leucyl aminopeptidase [Mesorhizobium sp. M7A.T.Ca.US.000.02.2.1]